MDERIRARTVKNEDFDKWQQSNLPLTSDAETYQLVRQIAVDFSNAVFPVFVLSERDAAIEPVQNKVADYIARIENGEPFEGDWLIEIKLALDTIRSRVAAQGEKAE